MEEVTLVADVSRPVGKSAARKIRRDGKVTAEPFRPEKS